MCDFRKIISVIIDGEVIPVKGISGHYHWFGAAPDNLAPGLYAIGASGVGMYYYDGEVWHSDYKNEMYKPCKFIPMVQ